MADGQQFILPERIGRFDAISKLRDLLQVEPYAGPGRAHLQGLIVPTLSLGLRGPREFGWESLEADGIVLDIDNRAERVATFPLIFNGSTWDRVSELIPTEFEILASAARTVDTTGPVATNKRYRGLFFGVNVTVFGGGTMTPRVSINTGLAGGYIEAYNFTAIAGTGNYSYMIYPGVLVPAAVTNFEVAGIHLARRIQIVFDKSDGSSWTYQVEGTWLP